MSPYLALMGVAVLSLAECGCESQQNYRLRFIDDVSKKPVQGARFEGSLIGHHFANRLFPAYGEEASSLSDTNGDAILKLTAGKGLAHYFTIRCPGYYPITGKTLPSQSESNWVLLYHTSETLPSETLPGERLITALPSAPVLIEMRPVTAGP